MTTWLTLSTELTPRLIFWFFPIMIMYTLYLKGLLSAFSFTHHPPQYQPHRPVENYPQYWFHYPGLRFLPHNILWNSKLRWCNDSRLRVKIERQEQDRPVSWKFLEKMYWQKIEDLNIVKIDVIQHSQVPIPCVFGKAQECSIPNKNTGETKWPTKPLSAEIATRNSCSPMANRNFTKRRAYKTNLNVAPNAVKPKKPNSIVKDFRIAKNWQ